MKDRTIYRCHTARLLMALPFIATLPAAGEELTVLDTTVTHNYNEARISPFDPNFREDQTTAIDVARFDSSLGILRQVVNESQIIYQNVGDVAVTAYGLSTGNANYTIDMRHRARTGAAHLGTSSSANLTTLIQVDVQTLLPNESRTHNLNFYLPSPLTSPVKTSDADRIPITTGDLNTFTTDYSTDDWSYQLVYNPGGIGSFTFGMEYSLDVQYQQHALIKYVFDRVGSASLSYSGGETLGDNTPSIVTSSATNATRASIIDSEALSGPTNVSLDMTGLGSVGGALAAGDGFNTLTSDVLSVSGLDGTLHVIEISYDDSGFYNYQDEIDNAALNWFDPVGGVWRNAVLGNSDAAGLDLNDDGAVAAFLSGHRFTGTYLSYLSAQGGAGPQLGDFGVNWSTNTVWAVIDHNSDFAAGVPEPTSLSIMGLAGLMLVRRRRS